MSNPEIAILRAAIADRVPLTELADIRKSMDARLGSKVPDDVTVTACDAGGVPAEWTITPGADAACVMLYLHGGGYVLGSLDSHRAFVAVAGRATGCRTLALHYRLAPEHKFPAAVEDAVAGYRYLLAQGVQPGKIVVAGDSAGGGLVVAALLAIRSAGLPQPAGGWCISPWVDMEGIGASMQDKAAADPMVQKAGLMQMTAAYLQGANPRDPLAAPIYGDLAGLAPLLIQVGAAETLLDDAIRLARVAGAADVPVTLEIWPEMIHVWPVFHLQLTAGRRAIGNAGAWMRAAMAGNPSVTQ